MQVNSTLLSGLKVLTMYQEREAFDVTKQALSFYGAEVITCRGVTEGLERLQTDRPDVILCDLGISLVNGYQFVEAVRDLPPDKGGNTPAVALSASSREEARTRAHNAGFQRYLCKPVQLTTLAETVVELAATNTTIRERAKESGDMAYANKAQFTPGGVPQQDNCK